MTDLNPPRGQRTAAGVGRVVASLAAVLLLASPSRALDPRRAITQYSRTLWQTEQGLPQNTVRAIAQTPDGFLWFGTQSGLVRFDGVRFTVFTRRDTPALINHHVYSLAAADDGTLWVGTNGGGLVRLKDGIFKLYGEREGLPAGRVTALLPVAGALWIGTYGGGLCRLRDGERLSVVDRRRGLSHDVVLSLAPDGDGGLWIGTFGGGLNHRAADGTIRVFGPEEGLADDVVWALEPAPDGGLWIGTNRGLQRLRDGVFTTYRTADGLADDGVLSLVVDGDRNLWIGTYGGGLQRLRDGVFSRLDERRTGASDTVWALFEDREGSLWVGTVGGGLMQLRDGVFTTFGRDEGLPSELVNTLAGDGGGLWIGTRNRGLVRLEGDRVRTYATADGLPHDGVWSLLVAADGSLWLGTNGGLARFAGGRFTTFGDRHPLLGEEVFCLEQGSDGSIWAGTNRGLVRLRDDRVAVFTEADGLAGDQIRALYEDRRGTLWIGAVGGLSRLRAASGDASRPAFDRFTRDDGLASDYVWSIYEDRQGGLWLATLGGGVTRYAGGRFTSLSSAQGLADDDVQAIVEDGAGNLWLGSGRGISRIARSELEVYLKGLASRVRPMTFDRRDGLKRAACDGGEPAVWQAPGGELWFATVGGAARVDPAHLEIAPAPPVILESVRVDGEPLERRAAPPGVPAGSRSFLFRFTAPTLRAPHKIRFRYRLAGFDDGWVMDGGQRLARYANLRPGAYRFEVMASDEAGVFAGAPTTFAFRVEKPFYRRWGVVAAAVAGALGLLYGLHHLRVARLERRERELARRAQDAAAHLRLLRGLLPICAECRKVRDEEGSWIHLETFLDQHSGASLSHGLCPQCAVDLVRSSGEVSLAEVRDAIERDAGD